MGSIADNDHTYHYHKIIQSKLDHFLENNKIPHIIFHGSSGTGKKTLVHHFIHKIYQNDRHKIKSNVMFVNCAHGKGIKFIRDELKFFAKTNIHTIEEFNPHRELNFSRVSTEKNNETEPKVGDFKSSTVQTNSGVLFKTIVLLNADFLTIDAQSALRRCIELFSYNTRFFIIVENKHKLLNPILSRFCEIYVPEIFQNGRVINLHQLEIEKNMNLTAYEAPKADFVREQMNSLFIEGGAMEDDFMEKMVETSTLFYEMGISCLDIINYIQYNPEAKKFLDDMQKTRVLMRFYKIKSEFRSEKLLMLCILDFCFHQLRMFE